MGGFLTTPRALFGEAEFLMRERPFVTTHVIILSYSLYCKLILNKVCRAIENSPAANGAPRAGRVPPSPGASSNYVAGYLLRVPPTSLYIPVVVIIRIIIIIPIILIRLLVLIIVIQRLMLLLLRCRERIGYRL